MKLLTSGKILSKKLSLSIVAATLLVGSLNAKEVVFIDKSISDYQTITKELNKNYYLIDKSQNGLVQISNILQNQKDIEAVHIISHGNSGELLLGNSNINSTNLNRYAHELKTIKESLKENGDILLYGCNVASGQKGEEFINSLATLTKADIGASTNLTGNAKLGGDWVLESGVGSVETSSFVATNYDQVLATPADQNFTSQTCEFKGSLVTIDGMVYSLNTAAGDQIATCDQYNMGTFERYFVIQDNSTDMWLLFNTDEGGAASPDGSDPISTSTIPKGLVDFRISSNDGSEFKLASMEADVGAHVASVDTTLTVKGYKDTVEVASDTIDFSASDSSGSVTYTRKIATTVGTDMAGRGGTLTFDSSWGNIDEIRFTGSSASEWGMLVVDNLVFVAPVASDIIAPTLSATGSSALAQTTATVSATSNETGTMYYVITTSATPPSNTQVVAGQNDGGTAAVKSSSDAATAATQKDFSVTALTAGTLYYVYFVAVDAASNKSTVGSASFTTVSANSAPTITGAVASQAVNDTVTLSPFSAVALADTENNNLSMTITLDTNAKGVLSGTGLSGTGPYTLASDTIANVQSKLGALVFNPADNRVAPASTETTTFTITANDGTSNSTPNTTTTVIS
ncbi:MAG: DUF4347 domain-containing protein, partial [Sulfurimonas sp.]|nr:DUF4347 domain-containing protein [Sulfurimonas sp.]